jgi:hypothetical protein
MAFSNSISRRGLLAALICLVIVLLGVYLAAHPERTFLLRRSEPTFFRASEGLIRQTANFLNPFRDRGPERTAIEIIAAAKRGDCNGEIWSTLRLPSDNALEAYYTVSRRSELCKDFASIEMEVVDYVYEPPKAYLLFSSLGLTPVLGKSSPMVGVTLERAGNQWKVTEFLLIEQGFKFK